MRIEEKLAERGLVLPAVLKPPAGMRLPFANVRVRGTRAFISGHGPTDADGALTGPLGKVGADVTLEQAYAAAQSTALSILASLRRELGDLDRVTAWLRVFGMVNVAPNFNQTPSVINGFSDLILDLYGPEIGSHARSAIGVAQLPLSIPVEIEAEVEFE